MIFNRYNLKLYEIMYLILILLLPISSRLNIFSNISITFVIMGLIVFMFSINFMMNKKIILEIDKRIITVLYMFLLVNCISYIFCDSKIEYLGIIKNMVIPILIAFFTIVFLTSKEKLYILFKILVYSGILVAILNSIQMVIIFNTLGYKGIGPLGNPNYFAGILSCILPLVIYENRKNSSLLNKLILVIYIGAIILSFSKTAWIGMVISIVILSIKDIKKSVVMVPLIIIFIYIFWNDITQAFNLNYIIEDTLKGFSGGTRRLLLEVSLAMSTSNIKNFIFGVGIGNFPINTYKYANLYSMYHPGSESHNILTDVLTETGIIGFGLFVLLLIKIFKAIRSIKSYKCDIYMYLSIVMIQILLYTVSHGAGRTFFYLWIFIGIAIRLRYIYKDRGTFNG
ncbi:O-antigen ligase family protein [Paraclostridium sordellii]|uniref:O-antigen ligase family protein n=5 Tax=Paraclostridium sordellii TaxID=1505 RepID=UPI000C77A303|nr:O-antigen ligase family protein [Paeniclostridium sordellii]